MIMQVFLIQWIQYTTQESNYTFQGSLSTWKVVCHEGCSNNEQKARFWGEGEFTMGDLKVAGRMRVTNHWAMESSDWNQGF